MLDRMILLGFEREGSRHHEGIAAGRDRLRSRERGHAARGISNRQEGAKSPRLHVVRGQEPLRPRRLPRGRPPKGNEAGRPPRTSTAAGLIRPLICRKLFASWVDRSWKRP